MLAGAVTASVLVNGHDQGRDSTGDVLIRSEVYGSALEPEAATRAGSNDYVVVKGKVVGFSEASWNTPDGRQPVGDGPNGLGTRGYSIYRTASVQVEEVLVGPPMSGTVAVSTLGGQVGGVIMEYADDVPRLEQGASVLLFLVKGEVVGSFAPNDWTPLLSYELKGGKAYHPVFGVTNETALTRRVQEAASR